MPTEKTILHNLDPRTFSAAYANSGLHAVRHNWRDEQLDLTPAATLKFGYKSSTEKDVTEGFGLQRGKCARRYFLGPLDRGC
jgi:hypothetical protein